MAIATREWRISPEISGGSRLASRMLPPTSWSAACRQLPRRSPSSGPSGAESLARRFAPEFLLAGANHLLGQVKIAPRLSRHLTLELAGETVLDTAKELLKFAVVYSVLLSSFHGPSGTT